MKTRLLALCIGGGMLAGAALAADQSADMRRAIAWERYKDLAAARQAAKEKKHPSVMYRGEASREQETAVPPADRVSDPGPRDYRITKQNDQIRKQLDKK
jgi:hypothetical protein